MVPPWFAGPSRSAALQAAAQRKGAAGTAGRGNGRTRRRLGPKGFARAAPRPSSAPRCLPGSTAAGSLQGSKSAYEKDDRRVNAKSLLGVLSLGIVKGTSVKILADGVDESAAIATLSELIDSNFSE